jgi:CHAT domain-containing protein
MGEKTVHSLGLKKCFKYLGLGGLTALLTVVLGLGNYSSVVGVAEVKAATPDSPTVQLSTPSTSQLVQEGQQRYQSGEFTAAVTAWKQAANEFAIQGDNLNGIPSERINQAMVLSNLALAYHQLGQWTEANQAITTSLQLLQTEKGGSDRKAEHDRILRLKTLAQALNTQGKLQLAQGKAEQALFTWQKATETYEQVGDKTGVVRGLINQAQALRVLGFYQRLKDTLEQANQVLQNQPDSAIKAVGLLSFGDALRLVGDLKKSQEVLQQSLALSQQLQSRPTIATTLLSLGNTLYAQQKFEPALKYYEQAIASSTSPTTTLQAQLNQLHLLIETLKSLRNDLAATNLDLQFSFRDSVEPVYRQLVGLLLQPPSNQGEVSQENLKQGRDVIESLQLAEIDNFFREACLTARSEQIDRIDPNAAVIYPIILPDRLAVILALPNKPLRHYATSIPQSELEDILSKTRSSLRRTSNDEERLSLAQRVYDWLIRPAESELAASNIKTLVFALDGSLKNLPMAVLYDGQQYLVEKYSVAVTPSLQLLEPQPLTRKQLQILVGGLSEARQGFEPLPGVKDEVQQIGSKLPGQVLLNQQFTSLALQDQMQAVPFPVVHLATHGQFSSNADKTFILAWDRQINVKQLSGLLQAREQNDRKPIELLVLSACETATGDNRAALGLAGVAVRSGARSTLATMWSVADVSTSELMVEFYRVLAQSQVTKAEALRHAQLTLLKQPGFRHPFYWAPFVLIGNWL